APRRDRPLPALGDRPCSIASRRPRRDRVLDSCRRNGTRARDRSRDRDRRRRETRRPIRASRDSLRRAQRAECGRAAAPRLPAGDDDRRAAQVRTRVRRSTPGLDAGYALTPMSSRSLASLAARAIWSLVILASFMGLLIFGPARTVRCWQGWVYLAV